MAQIILNSVAKTLARNHALNNIAKSALMLGAKFVGKQIDNSFKDPKYKSIGADLEQINIQYSSYGTVIPKIYGTVKLSGNIIWAKPISKQAFTTVQSSSGRSKFSNQAQTNVTEYHYYASFAVAICEGIINKINRIWIDNQEIPINSIKYTLHNGSATQLPDSIIEAHEGIGKTPAYRGIAYIVIDNLHLNDYANRIPNFEFEVTSIEKSNDNLEQQINAIAMIPASGEFVYDTVVQNKFNYENVNGNFITKGAGEVLNNHNNYGKANAVLSVENLKEVCPNVKWVSVVIGWFANNLNVASCNILPGVEHKGNIYTKPDQWLVAGFTRNTAYQISKDNTGAVNYGGTISDTSIVLYIQFLKQQGYKIMFYPILFVDDANKTWRGKITGNSSDVANFFTGNNGYNRFIIHYANLVKNYVDAFSIGSELIGITKIKDNNNQFPGVSKLIELAQTVRGIIPNNVKITYAADWSEYHHTAGGWYNLDPLWSSSYIDVIGIDAYFPLSNVQGADYDEQSIIKGWTSGEGYEWYYNDNTRTTKTNLSPAYAWKNIEWWWSNYHTNPDGNRTVWQPRNKKIWFTEYGFPSVDGCASQPNVFYDGKSINKTFPYLSKGNPDFLAQRTAISASLKKWKNSNMIEQMFLWTWDARPYPYWPSLSKVWSDTSAWITGHWVQGKLGVYSLATVLKEICIKAGLKTSEFDVTGINKIVDGLIINKQESIYDILAILGNSYFFDVIESQGKIIFIDRHSSKLHTINNDDLLEDPKLTRIHNPSFSSNVYVRYIDKSLNYELGNAHAIYPINNNNDSIKLSLPLVLPFQYANFIAKIVLYGQLNNRDTCSITLPASYLSLQCADFIKLNDNNYRVISVKQLTNGNINVLAVSDNANLYKVTAKDTEIQNINFIVSNYKNDIKIFELPILPSDVKDEGYLYFSVCPVFGNWKKSVLYQSDDNGENFYYVAETNIPTTVGSIANELPVSQTNCFDYNYEITVIMQYGNLYSSNKTAVLNGKNMILLDDELIQFKDAMFIANNKYKLQGLLRGCLGTEVKHHNIGSSFVLIDSVNLRIPVSNIGFEHQYKIVNIGDNIANQTAMTYTYQGLCFKPFSPVHIKVRKLDANNINVSWIRRTRFNGQLLPYKDVDLNEQREAYSVTVKQNNKVITSQEVSTTSYTHSVSGLNLNQPITYFIQQVSDKVNLGYIGKYTTRLI